MRAEIDGKELLCMCSLICSFVLQLGPFCSPGYLAVVDNRILVRCLRFQEYLRMNSLGSTA